MEIEVEGETVGQKVARLKNNRSELLKRLNKGWTWLQTNPDHPDFLRFEVEWMKVLHEYEVCCDEIKLYV